MKGSSYVVNSKAMEFLSPSRTSIKAYSKMGSIMARADIPGLPAMYMRAITKTDKKTDMVYTMESMGLSTKGIGIRGRGTAKAYRCILMESSKKWCLI